MSKHDERLVKDLVEILSKFCSRIIASKFCNWDDSGNSSFDKYASMSLDDELSERNYKEQLSFMLHYTDATLRHLYEGIRFEPEKATQAIGKNFIRDSKIIENELLNYIRHTQNHINVNFELWAHDIIRCITLLNNLFVNTLKILDKIKK